MTDQDLIYYPEETDEDEVSRTKELMKENAALRDRIAELEKILQQFEKRPKDIQVLRNEYGIYCGQLDQDQKAQGSGTMKWNMGFVYTGDWENNLPDGYGECRYSNGSSYAGGWKQDHYHGKGIIFYTDGSTLEGVWENGYLEGEGIFRFANGAVAEVTAHKGGYDEKGLFHGITHAKITYTDGTVYEGEVNGRFQPDGLGRMDYSNGVSMEGRYKNGKMNGLFEIRRENSIFTGLFTDGYIDEKGAMIGITEGTERSSDHIYTGQVDEYLRPHGSGTLERTDPQTKKTEVQKGFFMHGEFRR